MLKRELGSTLTGQSHPSCAVSLEYHSAYQFPSRRSLGAERVTNRWSLHIPQSASPWAQGYFDYNLHI